MSDYSSLAELGFSKLAIACYQDLYESGGSDADQMARRLGKSRTSLYRILKQLEIKGFVESIKTEPYVTYFYAEFLEKALENYSKYLGLVFRDLLDRQQQDKTLFDRITQLTSPGKPKGVPDRPAVVRKAETC